MSDRPCAPNSTLRVPAVPLARSAGLRPSAGPQRKTGLPRARIKPVPVPCGMCRAPAGPHSRYCAACREIRALVLDRDGYVCFCCGEPVMGQRYSLGHRLRASQGGKAIPSNLIILLGWGGEACHGRIDSRRDPRDEERGLTVRSWQDPAQVPVQLVTGAEVWLWDDGRYHKEGPQGVAAA